MIVQKFLIVYNNKFRLLIVLLLIPAVNIIVKGYL